MGYAGGTTANPTYQRLGDHTETVQMDYDPEKITYRELLEVFWQSHDPGRAAWSRQYMSAVFYHDEGQKRLALESLARLEATEGKVSTRILPFTGFTLAEDYHQKFRLRREPEFMREFNAWYPDARDLVASTAAARVNGYLGGYGTYEALKEEIDGLGLSEQAAQKLLDLVWAREKGRTPRPVECTP